MFILFTHVILHHQLHIQTDISCLKVMVSLLCSKEQFQRKIQKPVHILHLKFIYQLSALYIVFTYRLCTVPINDSAVLKWPSSRHVLFSYTYLKIFSLSQKSHRQKLGWYVNVGKKDGVNLLNELCQHLPGVTEKTQKLQHALSRYLIRNYCYQICNNLVFISTNNALYILF